MICLPLRKDQLTNSKAVCLPIFEAWKKVLLLDKMSDNQSRIFSGDDQQALEGGDFEPFRRQFDSSLYSGEKVSQSIQHWFHFIPQELSRYAYFLL